MRYRREKSKHRGLDIWPLLAILQLINVHPKNACTIYRLRFCVQLLCLMFYQSSINVRSAVSLEGQGLNH